VYGSIDQAVDVLARLARDGSPGASIPDLPEPALTVDGDGYEVARAVLADAGVPFIAQRTVGSRDEARAAAHEIGYPVVLKALGLLHKSDAGGVVLGLSSEGALVDAFSELERRLGASSYSVEGMAPLSDGVELLIGARWDPRFGPVALAGAGGVYAEILRDTAVALAPLGERDAEVLLRSLRTAPLLLGARGRPPLDLGAAAQALAALSRAAAAHPELTEIEVNPLLVLPRGAVALDARFVRITPSTPEERPWSSPTPPSSAPFATAPGD
jgi:hypothetical protein